MGALKKSIKLIEKSEAEIDALKATVRKMDLSDDDIETIIYGLNLIGWLPKLILEQNITIHRLKLLLFGKPKVPFESKSKDDKQPNPNPSDKKSEELKQKASIDNLEVEGDDDLNPLADDGEIKTEQPKEQGLGFDEDKKSGRTGRKPHTDYDAVDHYIPNENLNSGDTCPNKCGGRVYNFEPQVIIRINGQMYGVANRYTVDTKRCNLCGELFRPELPEDIGNDKYDAKFKAQLAVQKYYMGMPSYRQDRFLSCLNIPVAHSTQCSGI